MLFPTTLTLVQKTRFFYKGQGLDYATSDMTSQNIRKTYEFAFYS